MTHLDSQVAVLSEHYRAYMRCEAGCSSCCLDGFRIRLSEVLLLWEGLCQLPPADFADILQKIQSMSAEPQQPMAPCPLLDEAGRCRVYAHRPALCRAFGVLVEMDGNIATCHLNFTEDDRKVMPKEQLSTLQLTPFYEILDELSTLYAKALPNHDSNIDWTTCRSIREWIALLQSNLPK